MAKISRAKLVWLSLATIVVLLAAWWWFKPKAETPQYITAPVTRSNIEDNVLATGVLEATKMVSVGAQVSGQVKQMSVQLGDQVKQGQLIAQIDSIRQQNELESAQANIQNLTAQLAVQQANSAKVAAEYVRQQQMYAQDATSRAQLESARADAQTAKAQIAAIQAQIQQSRLTLDTAKENLSYTRIVAPMDGTVVAIVTEQGQTVNANQSTPTIVKLAKLDTMTIKAEVSEADVMKISAGQRVYFTTLGDSERKRYATLRQVEPAPESINTETTTTSSNSTASAVYYNALFDVPNPDHKLRINMTAQVYIVLSEAQNALSIPAAALQSSGKRHNDAAASTQTDASASTGVNNAKKSSNTPPDTNQNKNQSSPQKLKLSTAEQQRITAGTASLSRVKVLLDDGRVQEKQVLIGLNNRVMAQVLRGLKQGEQVILGDTTDSSNDAAKRNTPRGGAMRL